MSDEELRAGEKKTELVWQRQLPLLMAWGGTIDKAQGLRVGPEQAVRRLVLDVGPNEGWARGLLYVAVSRAELLSCLAFSPNPKIERFEGINKGKGATAVFAQLNRLNTLARRQ